MPISAVTTLSQMIPVIVLSGVALKLTETKEQATRSFNEVSREDAINTVGRSDVDVAQKNPNTIFHTLRGEILYTDGRYFVR